MAYTIGAYAEGHDNNFNLLRLLAAAAVIISHSWPLTLGSKAHEPLFLPGVTIGSSAVAIFFGVSGFLVAASWERQPSVFKFAASRGLRIFPGFAVMLLLTVAFAAVVSSLSAAEYFGNRETWKYFIKNLTLVRMSFELPGVFTDLPFPKAVNGSIWTLYYEVMC